MPYIRLSGDPAFSFPWPDSSKHGLGEMDFLHSSHVQRCLVLYPRQRFKFCSSHWGFFRISFNLGALELVVELHSNNKKLGRLSNPFLYSWTWLVAWETINLNHKNPEVFHNLLIQMNTCLDMYHVMFLMSGSCDQQDWYYLYRYSASTGWTFLERFQWLEYWRCKPLESYWDFTNKHCAWMIPCFGFKKLS